jgi:hypothetical protein
MANILFLVFAILWTFVLGNQTIPSETFTTTVSTTSTIKVASTTAATSRAATLKNDKCSDSLLDLDKKISNILFFLQPEFVSWKDSNEMRSHYCSKVPGWMKEAQEYRPCLKAFPRTIFNIILTNVKKAFKRFCLNPESMRLAVSHVKCLDNETRPGFLDIGDKVTTLLYHVSNMTDIDQVIPGVCCGANHLLIYCKEDIEKMCKSRARDDTDEFFINLVKSLLSDALDLMCGKFSSPKDCRAGAPDVYDNLLVAIDNRRRHSVSLIVPLLEVIQKLDGQVNL